uniref:Uncharacterized protein n=1 Tax=Myoviridae sp. ctLEM34 TaxID=2825082 RepID=A0A8S5TR34_9CAUD|nr:MAG TPA: hypothetical protein [Myoviridae sp. ctLEM34]
MNGFRHVFERAEAVFSFYRVLKRVILGQKWDWSDTWGDDWGDSAKRNVSIGVTLGVTLLT